eukprot:11993384-Karenia_brevis.AAC.1
MPGGPKDDLATQLLVAHAGCAFFRQDLWEIGANGLLLTGIDGYNPTRAAMMGLHWYAVRRAREQLSHSNCSFSQGLYDAILKQVMIEHAFSRRVVLDV